MIAPGNGYLCRAELEYSAPGSSRVEGKAELGMEELNINMYVFLGGVA